MSKLRIHVEAEPGKAAADGIDAEYLEEWLEAVIKAFASSAGDDSTFKIFRIAAGSIDSVLVADPQPMTYFVDAIEAAATIKQVSKIDQNVRAMLAVAPADREQLFELLDDNDNVIRTVRATAREPKPKPKAAPSAEVRTFVCTVDKVLVEPRRVSLFDAGTGKRVEATCSAEQSRTALELTDRSDAPALVAVVASSSGKARERTHRLLALLTKEAHEDREGKLERMQDTWSAEKFMGLNPDRFDPKK